jgi:CxxC motif-containing protein
MTKDTLSARISSNTTEKLEEYADERKISKSEATDRLLNKALRIESADVEIVPIATDGSGVDERITEQEEILSEINHQVESVIKRDKISNGLVTAGLAYVITILLIDIPTELGLALGVPLIVALIYANFVR